MIDIASHDAHNLRSVMTYPCTMYFHSLFYTLQTRPYMVYMWPDVWWQNNDTTPGNTISMFPAAGIISMFPVTGGNISMFPAAGTMSMCSQTCGVRTATQHSITEFLCFRMPGPCLCFRLLGPCLCVAVCVV